MPTSRGGAAGAAAVTSVLTCIATRTHAASGPLVVALDGRSGTGKSTLARAIAAVHAAAVVPVDDFFAATVPNRQWDAWTPTERAAQVVDWTRLRTDVLVPLRAGRSARWRPFDFAAGPRPDGSYAPQATVVVCAPQPLVLLEGAYAASPRLADLIDLAILVEAAPSVREQRLRAREDATVLAAWHARWDAVEAHYATVVRPRPSFDLVVATDDSGRVADPAAAG